MCSLPSCLLPEAENDLCPVHYVRKYRKMLSRECLQKWVQTYSDAIDDEYAEVDIRNLALSEIYGILPAYCYFSGVDDFLEKDWIDWWVSVLADA